ncbi:MAG TPA: hypothetical protein VG325_04625 [Solirubrobacteraceae bacterium]|nr:hypothetical protein [Solirubrobacteraceae bacterium]
MTRTPDLNNWLPDPDLRVVHTRESSASPDELWQAARSVRLSDAALLGRLVRWRIPGLPREEGFDQLFRQPPFMVLEEDEHLLVSGLVGPIWTLRRDYPQLGSAQDFRDWSESGTARVVIANWIVPGPDGRTTIGAEARVEAIGARGRLGVRAIRPLVRSFQGLVGSDGINAAVRRAERASSDGNLSPPTGG